MNHGEARPGFKSQQPEQDRWRIICFGSGSTATHYSANSQDLARPLFPSSRPRSRVRAVVGGDKVSLPGLRLVLLPVVASVLRASAQVGPLATSARACRTVAITNGLGVGSG